MSIPTPESKITLRELTADTVWPVLKLEVAESQRNYVAPNAFSIAQAYFERENAWFRGVYAGDTPVGFVMLYVEPENAIYDLWRLMIAEEYQRMGFGTRTVELIIEHVCSQPNAKVLGVSVVPGEDGALEFYQRFGFVETGEIDEGEIVMKLDLTTT